jgi:hypothetical protein
MADFSMITPRLATGAAISDAGDVSQLKAAGITHVLDLRAEFDDAPLLAGSGLSYKWNGTADDGSLKPAEWWEASLSFAVDAYSRLGTCLYCHCAAGHNRGPSTAYAVMRACWGLGGDAAQAMIRIARPEVTLAYVAQFDAWWPPPQWW